MSLLILDNTGQVIDFQCHDDSFDNEEGAAEYRFRESLNSDTFSLVVVLSEKKEPVAYCSFWSIIEESPFGKYLVLNVQINYVYVKPRYRGTGITKIMAPVVVKNFIEFAGYVDHVNIFYDFSEYIGEGGCKFGCKIREGLYEAGFGYENVSQD